jgi:hypothetical protein
VASSFDEKKEAQAFEDIFSNVFALYYALKSESRPQSIRRAELKQGEVTAEAIDFIADVELKSKRVVAPQQYRRLMSLVALDRYNDVPAMYRQALGSMFLRNDLNYDGAYRVLYYRAKNNRLQDRDEPVHFPEEATDGA